ncbi:hypothetical protein K523DRAFT_368070 [Schizophyllum commune Tattone D]|nr:hypothetical protein K523DRAFT_368070 [Schizophyllum commune Tattone D]
MLICASRYVLPFLALLGVLRPHALAYFLMAANNILTTQRIDPILTPGQVATHVHSGAQGSPLVCNQPHFCYSVVGGSNFGLDSTSSDVLRYSSCTSVPIREDKSNYWYPVCAWQNGTFSLVDGNPVIDDVNTTTPFPDDVSDPNLRTFDASSFAQQAVTYLCLQAGGASARFNELPRGVCSAGIRSQINFPSCWDGKNVDSDDHRSHVAFLSTGPDNGTCNDPAFPYTLPRIFMEASSQPVYWITQTWDAFRSQSYSPDQPFVFSNGDPTGYGYHADFVNGWEPAALKNALDYCHCNPYGDPSCCVAQGLFTFDQEAKCYITDSVEEKVKGTLDTLPGANPVQAPCYEDYVTTSTPAIVAPVYAYDGAENPVYTAFDGAKVARPTVTVAHAARSASVAQAAQGTCIYNGAVYTAVRAGWMMSIGILWVVYQLT